MGKVASEKKNIRPNCIFPVDELLASGGPSSIKDEKFRRAFQALLTISAPSQSTEAFLTACVQQIATAYGSKYAFIGMVQDLSQNSHIETISCYADGTIAPNMTYPLCGSPCQEVLKMERSTFHPGWLRNILTTIC